MINNTKAFGLLLAGTVLSSPTMAVEIPRALTLDRLNTETVAFLNNSANVDVSSLHDLNIDKSGENDVSVNIEGKTYYLAPKDAADHALLQTLSNIGSAALVKLDSAEGALYRLESDGETFYYGYNAEALPKSGYALAEISAEEAASVKSPVITKYTRNDDDTLTETYYKVNVADNYGSGDKSAYFKWSEEDGKRKLVEVSSSNEADIAVKYGKNAYKETFENKNQEYSVTDPSWEYWYSGGGAAFYNGYGAEYGDINDVLYSGNHEATTFVNNPGADKSIHLYGGAVSNQGTVGNVVADFVGNYINGEGLSSKAQIHGSGGAVNNQKTIGNITGDFVNNYIRLEGDSAFAFGGAIYNYFGASAGNINGNFVNNHIEGSRALGGAVLNYAKIGDVNGDFVYNHARSTSLEASGGAVFNNSSSTIGNVSGTFAGNYVQSASAAAYGGAVSNSYYATIGNLTGDFIGNYAQSASSEAKGGVVFNDNYSAIGNVSGDFIGNYVLGSKALGGAVYNSFNSTMGNFTGDFVNNYADGEQSLGGAVYNDISSTIGNLTGDFIGNYVRSTSSTAYGAAIYNNYNSSMGDINGNFIKNYAQSASSDAYGSAVSNSSSTIGRITGDFIENHAQGVSAVGGAVFNDNHSTVGNVTGDFVKNHVQATSSHAYGGAVANFSHSAIGHVNGDFMNNSARGSSAIGGAVYNDNYATIDSINGNFVNNSVSGSGEGYRYGGAVANSDNSTIGNLIGDFINNSAVSSGGGNSYGGAISNNIYQDGVAVIENISGNFIGNYALSSDSSSSAQGGAIYNESNIKNIVNSTFVDNYVKGDDNSNGGAIYSRADLLITANDGNSRFSGNKVNGKSNAVYMSGTEDSVINLSLNVQNKGVITFDDAVDGRNYNLNISGDGTGVVKINKTVDHVNTLTLASNSITHLGIDGDIRAVHMNAEGGSVVVRSQSANVSPIITVDVEVDKAANKVNTGTIHVSEDVNGNYRVLVNSLNPNVLPNKDDAIVPFLFAPEDDEETSSSFSVARVIGSPYMWDGAVNAKGEDAGSTWYLNLTDILNPDYKPDNPSEPSKPVIRSVAPEVIAGEGLHEAALEQTRSVVRNVGNKVAAGREYCPNCGIYSTEWNGKKLRNVWALAQGETATIDKPVDMDADIWGLEAGFDVQNDVNNTLGVFASYRKGDYDLNGKGGKVRSNIGSEIDIDSYLAGLYYRYDKNMNWLFAAVYGGIQEADAKTDDGLAKFDTDGIEFGASVEAGHTFALSDDLTLNPSLGLYYTQINFDDATDNLGKTYDWKDIKHLEAELGVKLEKQSDDAKVYVKPSVIQTITNGDSVRITGLKKLNTYDDQTLGRIELGGRYGFTDALSAYGWVNYTFGSAYKATAGGLGLGYSW